MTTKQTETHLLQRTFKVQATKEPQKSMDPDEVVQEQNFSTTRIKKLAIDMPKSKHKATSETHRLLLRIKHLKSMGKTRHKTTNEHFHSPRTDPSLSPPRMAQTVLPQ